MLKSYANKANKQANKMKNRYGPALRAPGNEGEYKKFANRQDGEDLARTKLAMRKEEFEAAIAGLSERHQGLMSEVFSRLNEENQQKFAEACKTEEGLEAMVAFAIENRGE